MLEKIVIVLLDGPNVKNVGVLLVGNQLLCLMSENMGGSGVNYYKEKM